MAEQLNQQETSRIEKVLGAVWKAVDKTLGKRFTKDAYMRAHMDRLVSAVLNDRTDEAQEIYEDLKTLRNDEYHDRLLIYAIRVKTFLLPEYAKQLNMLVRYIRDRKKRNEMKQEVYYAEMRSRQHSVSSDEGLDVVRLRIEAELKEIKNSATSEEDIALSIGVMLSVFMRNQEFPLKEAVDVLKREVATQYHEDFILSLVTIEVERTGIPAHYYEHRGRKDPSNITIQAYIWDGIEEVLSEVSKEKVDAWWDALLENTNFSHSDLERILSHIPDEARREELMRQQAFDYAKMVGANENSYEELERFSGAIDQSEQDSLYATAILGYFEPSLRFDFDRSRRWEYLVTQLLPKIKDESLRNEVGLAIVRGLVGMGARFLHGERKSRKKMYVEDGRSVAKKIQEEYITDDAIKAEIQTILGKKSRKNGIWF